MPGLTSSNFSLKTFTVLHHNSASDFLSVAYPTLRRFEQSSNIILAHALKRVSAEAVLSDFQFLSESDVEEMWSAGRFADLPYSFVPFDRNDSFWLTVWSSSSPSEPPSLDLILSCINWTLGDYPIFLWSPHRTVSSAFLVPRIVRVAEHLSACVPPQRVFSVFGRTPLVKTFARYWTDLTGFAVEPEPFYAAAYTFCTPESFKESDTELPGDHRLRRAFIADLESVAQLCKEFADDSIYFPLTIEKARVEAQELIFKGQIWVYEAQGEITALCAVTRSSLGVSAVTKVYTVQHWRKKGCAQHLVRYVTAKLLFEHRKESVVLYVGHTNSAQRVYDKVGFVGLCGKDKPDGVEDSLEVGFVGTDRGHW